MDSADIEQDAVAISETASVAEAIGPRVYGVIDVIRPDRVAGWAIDRADSRTALEVEVIREGTVVATVRANRQRRDLEKSGVGSGRYGFSCDLTPPLEPGFEFTISARARTSDDVVAELRRAGKADREIDPDRRLLERLFDEVTGIRSGEPSFEALAALRGELEKALANLEVAQARIEAALASVGSPERSGEPALKTLLAITFAMAAGSLGLGVFSMFQP